MQKSFVLNNLTAVFRVCLVISFGLGSLSAYGNDWQRAVETIKRSADDYTQAPVVQQAWRQVAAAPIAELPQLLTQLDGASPLAANWLRSAIDAVVDRARQAQQQLPVAQLKEFLADTSHTPRARRLAYELIVADDAKFAAGWLPQAINDPSLEIRRDAVAFLLEQAQSAESQQQTQPAIELFQRAFAAARDEDQIKLAADKLKSLDQPANVTKHYGFVTEWKLIGPFDNVGGVGFGVEYPPELRQDFEAPAIPGKLGPVAFRDFTTTDEMGQVDLNAVLGKEKGAVAYAVAEFYSAQPQAVELRLGTPNANKIWFNGKLVHEAKVYHAFEKLDQYIARGKLEPGRNVIVLKICQNEQTEQWAQDWKFQFRVCDETGGAVLSNKTE